MGSNRGESASMTMLVSSGLNELMADCGTLDAVSWTPPQKMSYEQWEEIGRKLQQINGSLNWWLGDWVNEGQWRYGEKFAQAIQVSGHKEEHLRACQWVSRRIKRVTRVTLLSWTHHRYVAHLEDEDAQRELLKFAAERELSSRDLLESVREYEKNLAQEKEKEKERAKCQLIIGQAEELFAIDDESVDIIITSPPYNMGVESWPMGGEGRQPRPGIAYEDHFDELDQASYESWQLTVLQELYRVAKPGASFFYNHKPRTSGGVLVHPLRWLLSDDNPWLIRQEIVWDRKSTHNHSARLFWPHDERIYWMTKGQPNLTDKPIGMPTIWQSFGPVPGTWHPAPFTIELPRMLLEAIDAQPGQVVLDPFAGSCTTLIAALERGCYAVGVDVSQEYLARAAQENGWIVPNYA
jgi:DNA modification methylase